MRLSLAASVASACLLASAQAFKDTSPFILFSNSPLPSSLQAPSEQLQSSHEVLHTAKEFLKTCPSEVYFIISQPNLSSAELSTHSPHLKTAISKSAVKARIMVNEVLGLRFSDGEELTEFVREKCGAKLVEGRDLKSAMAQRKHGDSAVVFLERSGLQSNSPEDREDEMRNLDSNLYSTLLKDLPNGVKYTVIFTTTKVEKVVAELLNLPEYEPEFAVASVLKMDLKRDLRVRGDNGTRPDLRPLFEQYQFLTPGLFMGLLVGIILLSILYVGISGVSSLQVSYGAFDKEMGPAAQKKQQ